MQIKHYQIHCETDGWQDWYLPEGDAAPTTCPVDTEHAVTEDSTVVLETIGPDSVEILNDDGEIANWPMTESRTPISVPNIVPPGYYAYITGAFDNVAGNSLGNGEQMVVEKTDEGDGTLTGQFIDHFYVLNGSYHDDDGAKIRDWVTMHLYAEASTPAVAPGGDGNADLYAPYFVPNHAGTGGYNVDGAALTVGEINTGLVPLPAYNAAGQPIGHWNWDPTQSPSITPIAVGDMGAPNGHYALLSVPAGIIGRQANRLPLKGGCQNCVPEVVKGKKILPHWKIVFTLHRSAAGSTGVAFEMKVARKRTV